MRKLEAGAGLSGGSQQEQAVTQPAPPPEMQELFGRIMGNLDFFMAPSAEADQRLRPGCRHANSRASAGDLGRRRGPPRDSWRTAPQSPWPNGLEPPRFSSPGIMAGTVVSQPRSKQGYTRCSAGRNQAANMLVNLAVSRFLAVGPYSSASPRSLAWVDQFRTTGLRCCIDIVSGSRRLADSKQQKTDLNIPVLDLCEGRVL
jgi:hypothetical protein